MASVGKRQVGGTHYVDMAIQPWDVMQACMSDAEFRGFLRGNVIRYAMRLGRKDSDDLGKLIHYAEKLRSLDEPMEFAAVEPAPIGPTLSSSTAVQVSWSEPEGLEEKRATDNAYGWCPCQACAQARSIKARRLAREQPADGAAEDRTGAGSPATP